MRFFAPSLSEVRSARARRPFAREEGDHALGVLVLLLAHRDDHRLLRREPEGEGPARVLDVDGEEALQRAEDGAVEHHGAVRGAVGAGEGEVEALGELVVELEGAELPAPPQRVLHVELVLGAVEGALAGGELVGQAVVGERVEEGLLGGVPLGVGAHALVGAGGQLDVDLLEPERLVNPVEQLDEAPDLGAELILRAEDVGVVLVQKLRTRARPWTTPPRSKRCSRPKSATRQGSSR